MVGILGKKIGMTQIFDRDGTVVPVTVVSGGPCFVLQIKTKEIDGYNALQLGFEDTKESRVSKPLREKFKKVKVTPKKWIKEILISNPGEYTLGQQLDVSQFNPGDFVDVISTSRGLGFQGGTKRWHWKLGPKTHGGMSHREPGSIGASACPSRVFKGHHLPGHMGNERVTVQNVKIIQTDKENNLITLKGSVAGHKNCYLIIRKATKKKKVIQETEQQPVSQNKEQDNQGKPPVKVKK